MQEVEMSLEDVRNNFGSDVADECATMKHMEVKEFYVATYEAIIVRCEKCCFTTYYVSGENVLEEALELELDDGLDW